MLKAVSYKHKLIFKIPGGTSRGILKTKDSWFIKLYDDSSPHIYGLGEASIIKNLSPDDRNDFDEKLSLFLADIHNYNNWEASALEEFPSIKFAIETALLDLQNSGRRILFESDFSKKNAGIKINGLIWMGKVEFMKKQIIDKINSGFSCLKLKIGAIDFEEELNLLRLIRNEFSSEDIELRVDANGAFSAEDALEKLKQLSEFNIHSIEQPIAASQWEHMHQLCKQTPIPIALDEELIGVKSNSIPHLLDSIKPQYIILKPSLIGGFERSNIYIQEAEKRNIGWWATSALEANIGLNAIAQWVSTKQINMPQGLGTGHLFTNNINSPLEISDAKLHYNNQLNWDLNLFSHG